MDEIFLCESCDNGSFIFYTSGIIECANCGGIIGWPVPENEILH